jgi:hypothetical protein
MVKGVLCRKDGSETTALRCRAENCEDNSVWVAKGACVSQNEIVDVLRTNATGEDGFTFIQTSENVQGFVKSEHINMLQCPICRPDDSESTMLRCRAENSEKSNVWVKGKVCVAQNEVVEVLRVNSAGEAGWAFVRTQKNIEGFVRACYVGAPSDSEIIEDTVQQELVNKGDEGVDINESRQSSRRTSSRIAAVTSSITLHSFFSKSLPKANIDDDTPPTPSKASIDNQKSDADAIRRSSRVRAPTKFLVKEAEPSQSLDKWLQKVQTKTDGGSENGEDAGGEDMIRPSVVNETEERPLGEYFMKLRTCAL